jgi:hypothetical protein
MLSRKERRHFNMNDKKDVEIYRQFLLSNSWGESGCPFILEFPALTVPDMIKDRLIRKFLKV